jgi:hypothetical protein
MVKLALRYFTRYLWPTELSLLPALSHEIKIHYFFVNAVRFVVALDRSA